MAKVFGIAGYMGSGKTTVGRYFEKLGAEFIDADDIVDDLYLPNHDGWLKIVNYFGHEYLLKNGEINRRKLAKFVFGNVNKLKSLNNLIHPLVMNEVMKLLQRTDADFVVIEATYFEEKYLLKLVDKILWVDCPKEILKKRMWDDRDLDAKMAEQIFRLQGKPERVDYIVQNNGNTGNLYDQLREVWNEFTAS